MTVFLRNSQEYKDFTLKRLYGILKTYELEMEKDDQIEKGQKKGGSIALVVDQEKQEDEKDENARHVSKCVGSWKENEKMNKEEESFNQEDVDELDEHLAFLSRRFSKLKFKKNPEVPKHPKHDYQPNKKLC